MKRQWHSEKMACSAKVCERIFLLLNSTDENTKPPASNGTPRHLGFQLRIKHSTRVFLSGFIIVYVFLGRKSNAHKNQQCRTLVSSLRKGVTSHWLSILRLHNDSSGHHACRRLHWPGGSAERQLGPTIQHPSTINWPIP